MKTKLSALLVGFVFIFSGSAFALSFYDVGLVDEIIGYQKSTNSGEDNELRFLLGLASDADVSSYRLYKASTGAFQDLGNDIYAVDFYTFYDGYSPERFMIKTGANVTYAGGTYDNFLYSNLKLTRYGVIDLSVFGRSNGDVEIAMVSHVSGGPSGPPVQVPEPTTLLLFGAGLAGLAVYRRRSSK